MRPRPPAAARVSRLASVGLEPRPDRLLIEELGEPLFAAVLCVEELGLVELCVEVVLGRVPAHLTSMLEAEAGGAERDRILLEQLTGQRLDLGAELGQRDARVDEPHLCCFAAVKRPPSHDVEEGVAYADRLGEGSAYEAPGGDAPVDLGEAEGRL